MALESKCTAVLLGGTGIVGRHVLQNLLLTSCYSKIRVLVRDIDRARKLFSDQILDSKVEWVVFDFDRPDNDKLNGDHIYCCLGTTINAAGSRDRFRQVDHEYVFRCAAIAKAQGATVFAVITAMGADARSGIFYNRTKGKIEEALESLNFRHLIILRPSLLMSDERADRKLENVAIKILRPINHFIPKKWRGVDPADVARTMVNVVIDAERSDDEGPSAYFIESKDMIDEEWLK